MFDFLRIVFAVTCSLLAVSMPIHMLEERENDELSAARLIFGVALTALTTGAAIYLWTRPSIEEPLGLPGGGWEVAEWIGTILLGFFLWSEGMYHPWEAGRYLRKKWNEKSRGNR